MAERKDRLRKLVVLQDKMKTLHETRHAGYVAAAVAAREEATQLAQQFDRDDSLAMLFPEIYHRSIGVALSKEQANLRLASIEAERVAIATARTNMVERAWREAVRLDDRVKGERDALELMSRQVARRE